MQVHVTFYGVLKAETGTKQQAITLQADAPTVSDLTAALAAQYPVLADRLPTVAAAVRDTLVTAEHVLRDGDQVALLPPVSGG